MLRRGIVLILACLPLMAQRAKVTSHVTIMEADGKGERILYSAPKLFEAPNWSPDGKYLLLNSEGKLWKLALSGGEPQAVDSGSVDRINNDHGISPEQSRNPARMRAPRF